MSGRNEILLMYAILLAVALVGLFFAQRANRRWHQQRHR